MAGEVCCVRVWRFGEWQARRGQYRIVMESRGEPGTARLAVVRIGRERHGMAGTVGLVDDGCGKVRWGR